VRHLHENGVTREPDGGSTAEDRSAATEAPDSEAQRRYRELLEELRTMMPGTQVLLAFLLTVPFSNRFEEVDQLGKVLFVVSLGCAATATVLFLSPTAYHRLADRDDRRTRLHFGIRTAVTGLILLGTAISIAVFVVVRFLFEDLVAAGLAGAVAALALTIWIVVPIVQRSRSDGESQLSHW
jgi:MFS family permease